MKTSFKIGNVEAQGIKLENIDIQVEYSLDEIAKGFDFLKGVISDVPQLISQIQNALLQDTLNDLTINRIIKEDFNKTAKETLDEIKIPRELMRILKFGA